MSGVPLRVLSYNVHGLRDDRSALTGLIRELEPDVVVVQEAPRRFRWRHKCAALADDIGMVVAAGGLPALGNLILVTLRVSVHETWCLRYPLIPGRHLRGAAFARCSVKDARFTVSGSHLATDPIERPAQAAQWKSALVAVEGPLVAAGDLNEGPGGPSWRLLERSGYVDHGSSRWRTFPADRPERRIDALLVRGDVEVLHHGDPGVEAGLLAEASDHRPVLAVLEI